MNELLNRLAKNSTVAQASILDESLFFNKDLTTTNIPILNVACSGSLDGGFASGITMWAGPSKHFKTAFSLTCAKAYLDRYDDAVVLFYDSEFGSPRSYFEIFDIDTSRVLHTPIENIEALKFDLMSQLEKIKRGDHAIILVDSIGNVPSNKEVEDALNKKSVADMTRAKQIKSLFRMITTQVHMKDIPMIVVNHTYKEQSLYPRDIVSGGTGPYYSADNIFIVGRKQEKDSQKQLSGYVFVINVEKSRFVKEKSKLEIYVDLNEGISRYSGLLELALESGHVISQTRGWYSKVNKNPDEENEADWNVGKGVRIKDTQTEEFWSDILNDETFQEFVRDKYQLS